MRTKARSKSMFAVGKPDGNGGWLLMGMNRKTFIPQAEAEKARWYAYVAYAHTAMTEHKDYEAGVWKILKAPRNESICKAGGQKYQGN